MSTTHILIAGKDSEISELARTSFQDLDCQFIPASSMTLALFLAQKNLPDLIICIFGLHGKDSWDFLTEVKTDVELSSIPFVFIDRGITENDRAAALREGADAVLTYPLDSEQLRREIIPFVNIRLAEKVQRDPQTPE